MILFHSRKASFVFLILFYPNLHSAKLLQFPMKHFSGLSSFILLQKIPGRKRDHRVSSWYMIYDIFIWSASLSDSIKSLRSLFLKLTSVAQIWMIWLWLAKILLILNFIPTQTAFESESLTLEQDPLYLKWKWKYIRPRCHCI